MSIPSQLEELRKRRDQLRSELAALGEQCTRHQATNESVSARSGVLKETRILVYE